ncbi:hypothetical protein B4U79_08549, partial [Dinothrombium tinctorium]
RWKSEYTIQTHKGGGRCPLVISEIQNKILDTVKNTPIISAKVRVWRIPNDYSPKVHSKIANGARFSINIHGYITGTGKGGISWIKSAFNRWSYIRLLTLIIPEIDKAYPDSDWVYQENNCRVHTAMLLKKSF